MPARAARVAGALYLIQMAAGVLGFYLRSTLMVRGDVTQTAQQIVAAERTFRVAIAADLATVCAVIALVWTLYVLLSPVRRDLALLGAFFRIAEGAVLCAVTVNLLVAMTLFKGTEYLNAFGTGQLNALGRLFISGNAQGYTVAFVLLGLGSAAFAYAFFESRYIPRLIAGWGVIASLLFTICAGAMIVFPESGQLLQMVSWPPMGIYEVGLGAWLLIRGVTISSRPAGA